MSGLRRVALRTKKWMKGSSI
jgi:hypothetical protein